MIKKLFTIALILTLVCTSYYTYKLVKYTKRLTNFNEYVSLKLDCSYAVNTEQTYLIWRLRNKTLKPYNGISSYHANIDACNKFARYMCWIADADETPEKHDKCLKKFEE